MHLELIDIIYQEIMMNIQRKLDKLQAFLLKQKILYKLQKKNLFKYYRTMLKKNNNYNVVCLDIINILSLDKK